MGCKIMYINLTLPLLFIFLQIRALVSTNSTLKINKCCPHNQQLYLDGSNKFKCINLSYNTVTLDQRTNADVLNELNDVWWTPDYLNFIEINKSMNDTEIRVTESVKLTRKNFILDKPIACFHHNRIDQEPEFLLVQPNVFIDVHSSELVLTNLEKGPEYTAESYKANQKDGPRQIRNVKVSRNNSDKRRLKMSVGSKKHDKLVRAQRTAEEKGELSEEINIGRHRLEGLTNIDHNMIRSKFPNNVYCIDRIALKTEEDVEEDAPGSDDKNTTSEGEDNITEESEANDWSYIILLCPCHAKSNSDTVCVRKCCPDRQLLLESDEDGDSNAHCVPYEPPHTSELDVEIVTLNQEPPQSLLNVPHYIVHGPPSCRHGSYLLRNDAAPQPDGTALSANVTSQSTTAPRVTASPHFKILRNSSVYLTGSHHLMDARHYCIDSLYNGTSRRRIDANILLCRPPEPRDHYRRRILYTICFIVGTSFLVLTLGVYAVLSELRKSVHSWNIMAHIACSIVAYTAIVIANLFNITYPTLCILVAYVLQISFLSSQLWLNAMCIDIACTFSGLRAPSGRHFSDVDRRKFIYYSIYTWGTTALISGLTYVADSSGLLAANNPLKPNFGGKACWFRESASIALFFYGPISLLLVTNLVLFNYTCWKIRSAQKDTAITSGSRHVGGRADEQARLTTFIKLFLLMGVTWTFEIVSWVIGGPYYIWYLTDLLNVLRGFFIFIILCCKRNVLAMLHRRIKHGRRRRGNAGPRPRAESTTSRRHSKSSFTTEHMTLSKLNLSNNPSRIVEEEEGGVSPGAGAGEGQPLPPPLSVVEEVGEEMEAKC